MCHITEGKETIEHVVLKYTEVTGLERALGFPGVGGRLEEKRLQ